jgi:hypothetical protein
MYLKKIQEISVGFLNRVSRNFYPNTLRMNEMPLFDWKCPRHGVFESSHPICPEMGCNHKGVEKIFLKAPGFKSDMTKRTDAGFEQTASKLNMTDMSNRNGNSVKQNASTATSTHWGTENIGGMQSMRTMAATAGESGLATAARSTGFDKRKLPPATITSAASDGSDRAKVVKN